MDSLFFPLLVGCAVALVSALGVVLARRPIYAAMFLLVHSLSLAALFGILSAAMVAVGQVIIYSGAIVVLFLFVVTLLPSGGVELGPRGAAVGHALFGPLLVAFELTAPLLLVAIVGAVVIWRRREPHPRTAHVTKVAEPRRLVMHR